MHCHYDTNNRYSLKASKFPCLKFIEIVILWVYYTIPFGFTLFWQFLASLLNIINYVVWLRISDEGSVPEMRIWSISNLIDLNGVYILVEVSFWIKYIRNLLFASAFHIAEEKKASTSKKSPCRMHILLSINLLSHFIRMILSKQTFNI